MNVQVKFLKNEALGKMTHNLKSFDKGRKCEKKYYLSFAQVTPTLSSERTRARPLNIYEILQILFMCSLAPHASHGLL